jgi:parallel beta-helix repeat protein
MPRIALSIAALVLGLAGGRLACGGRITKDTKLERDLINCPSNGVVIGADNVTLDLNGHVIDGDGTEFADCPDDEICDVGVLNDGHDGVELKDGSVRGFGVGARITVARDNRVVGISSTRNTFFGAVFGGASRSVIRDSSLSHNIAPEGDGMGLFGADHIRIIGNSIQHNAGPGIHVSDSSDNLIKRNLLTGNGPSLLIEGNRNEGRGNLVTRNLVARSDGAGIRLGIVQPTIGGTNNVVRRNEVKNSNEDGFLVYVKDDHSLLEDNIAIGSKDDGFDIESRTTTLIGNRAIRSGDADFER